MRNNKRFNLQKGGKIKVAAVQVCYGCNYNGNCFKKDILPCNYSVYFAIKNGKIDLSEQIEYNSSTMIVKELLFDHIGDVL